MRYLLPLLLTLVLASPALAAGGFEGPGGKTEAGGFQGPGMAASITKAAQVKDAADDTPAVLEGFLLEKVKKDKYLFQDDSGKVIVEIDHDTFRGQTVTPKTRIRITGEVEHKRLKDNRVDVKRLEILK